MRFGLMVMAALMGAPVAAQDLPSLSEVTAEIDGREVQVSGGIGRDRIGPDGDWTFRHDGTFYATTLALDRKALSSIEACAFELFGATGCPATVSAELDIKNGRVGLIIFDLSLE